MPNQLFDEYVDDAGQPVLLRKTKDNQSDTDQVSGLFKIAEHKLTADGAVLDVQNIPQTYDDLEVRVRLRSTTNGLFDAGNVALNNDITDANYRTQYFQGNVSAMQVTQNLGATGARAIVGTNGATATAGTWATAVLRILDYALTDNIKIVTMVDNSAIWNLVSGGMIARHGMMARTVDTAAVNRISIAPAGTPFTWLAGSRMSVYGVKRPF